MSYDEIMKICKEAVKEEFHSQATGTRLNIRESEYPGDSATEKPMITPLSVVIAPNEKKHVMVETFSNNM